VDLDDLADFVSDEGGEGTGGVREGEVSGAGMFGGIWCDPRNQLEGKKGEQDCNKLMEVWKLTYTHHSVAQKSSKKSAMR
jgi:hypothetical protein